MKRLIRREVRRRGILGWATFVLFVSFNAAMALWLYDIFKDINVPEAQEVITAQMAWGIFMGVVKFLTIWMFGAIITGALACVFRGDTVIIDEVVDGH